MTGASIRSLTSLSVDGNNALDNAVIISEAKDKGRYFTAVINGMFQTPLLRSVVIVCLC